MDLPSFSNDPCFLLQSLFCYWPEDEKELFYSINIYARPTSESKSRYEGIKRLTKSQSYHSESLWYYLEKIKKISQFFCDVSYVDKYLGESFWSTNPRSQIHIICVVVRYLGYLFSINEGARKSQSSQVPKFPSSLMNARSVGLSQRMKIEKPGVGRPLLGPARIT